MIKLIFRTFLCSLLVSIQLSPALANDSDTLVTEQNKTGQLFNQSDEQLLAEIYFSKHHVIKFEQDLETEAIYISEIRSLDGGEDLYGGMVSGTPLEKFLQLTGENVAVPYALVDHDVWYKSVEILHEKSATDSVNATTANMSQRTITDDVVIDLGQSLMTENAGVLASQKSFPAGNACLSGDAGNIYFMAAHCIAGPSSVNHGSGWNQSYCDSNPHSSIQRTSSRAVRTIYSRVANCGTGDAAIIHSHKTWGSFSSYKTWFLGDNRIGGYESAAGKNSVRLYRRVNILKVTLGGYMRAKTVYWRNR